MATASFQRTIWRVIEDAKTELLEDGMTAMQLADRILEHEPDLFQHLAHADQRRLLGSFLSGQVTNGKRRAIRATPSTRTDGKVVQPVIRVAASGSAYWSQVWSVSGALKETRALTRLDLEQLVRDRHHEREELRAQIAWLTACLDLLKRNRADRLGQLEVKGIELPSVEIDVEA